MKEIIAELGAKVPYCQTRDQRSFTQRLEKMRARAKANQPISNMQAQLQAAIDQSLADTERRQLSVGVVQYPELPVSERKEEIKAALLKHQVVVVAGETGSGKTTQLPKICLEAGFGAKGLIGHTQPRRIAARTVAARIAEELNTTLGEKVGYQVRFTDQVSDASLIKLMTDGILLAETQHDPLLEKYEVIIIDEAHERSLNIDFLLGYIRRILPQRPDLKLIITSATIDLERFSKHFNSAPIIEVSGRIYPVEVCYRPLMTESDDEPDRTLQQGILHAVEEIIAAKKTSGPRDILVFLSGEREIREAADMLRKAELKNTEIMPLYARLSVAEQNRVFQGGRQVGRRIVLATNVAETSVTVPGIGYVIDTGVARISRYSYRSKVQRLPIEPISQASANQRAGRCGRIAPGVCYRLYSEEDFIQRPAFTDAEIRRTNLAAVILQMLLLKLGDIADFPFIDPPDSRFITDGFKLLEELGAVDVRRKLTPLGRTLSQLPVDPRIGRMIIEAAKQGALTEVLVIASALSVQDPRERPVDKQQAADQQHRQYLDEQSDFMTFLNLWNSYETQRQVLSQNQLRKYCQQSFLSFLRMREWRDIHRQLHLSCKQLNLKENTEPADYRAIHVSLLAGLLSHMGFRQENKEFLGARNRKFHIFPASALFKKPAKWIMAAELVETSRLFARTVAAIEPEWAEMLAKHLVKRTYLEPAWHKKRAQVVATEQVSLYGLLIVPKRTVNYGAIDPQTAQQIFIRSALVEGHFHTQGAFFQHNRNLLEHVEALEAKSRRKDLLVDEETLYQFYADKFTALKGTQVVNGAGFEKWRKNIEADNPKALFLTEADILQRSTEHVSAAAYPDQILWKGMRLALSYHFEPGSEDDGVTLTAPIPLLKQLPVERMAWLVPGMLQDKCVALLKGLPKQVRKHFVPVPDFAKAVAEAMVFGDGNLYEAIAHQLLRMSGTRVDPELLKACELDAHHQMNIRLLDEKGKQVAQGRNWQQLCERFGERAEQAIQESPQETWGRKGITRWDFGELPGRVQLKQAGGIKVDAWPVLLDRQDSVELSVVSDQALAAELTKAGLVRLALLNSASVLKQIRGRLPKLNETLLLSGKIFTKRSLEDQIIHITVRELMKLDEQLPTNQMAFEQRLSQMQRGLSAKVLDACERVYGIQKQVYDINKQLNGKVSFEYVTILNDIKMQLSLLIHPEYLVHISWQRLEKYPRYMDAIENRLEKFARELPRQRMLSEQLQQFYKGYQQLADKHRQLGLWSAEADAFRWYLEEYRVSLFAQQLKTDEPVSEKRVRQRWQTLQRD